MLWKVAARVYIKKRREFAGMDAATFAAYREKWQHRAEDALHNSGMPSWDETRAKWQGFQDALLDEENEREGLDRGDTIRDELAELSHLLDYLYREDEDG